MAPTREEIDEAVRMLQAELDATAPQIAEILDKAIATKREAEDRVPTDLEVAQARVKAAQLEVDRLKDEADALRQAEWDAQRSADLDVILAAGPEYFVADGPHFDSRPYVLPFGKDYAKFNPLSPEDAEAHEFGKSWLANSTALICRRTDQERTRPSRLIWTSGLALADSDKIGRCFEARHDQTGSKLGDYMIVGLVFYGPTGDVARVVGEVPAVKFPQATYK